MKAYLQHIATGQHLSQEQAEAAMHLMMRGEGEPEEIAAFLMGLRTRGESLDELIGFTRVMRTYAIPVELPDEDAIDLCGTGGDQSGTFNISTTAAFVCAGAGITVAKHGNRSISSKCGSADVLAELGVEIELRKEGVEYCLNNAGIAFIFAPFFHPAMKYVMPVRRKLGARTFFNILGPLCNPAGVRRQLVGAFSLEVAETMGKILAALNAQRVVALHAKDGLDECSIAAPTTTFKYDASAGSVLVEEEISPATFGISTSSLSQIKGDSAAENAVLLKQVLQGEKGPHRDIVVMNAALALWTSGKFSSQDQCLEAAVESIDSGNAQQSLTRLIQVSQKAPKAAV